MSAPSFGNCDCKECTQKKICPLPRIGSKEWGWTKDSAAANKLDEQIKAKAAELTGET